MKVRQIRLAAARRRLIAAFVLFGLMPLSVLTGSSLLLSQQAVRHEVGHRINSSAQIVDGVISASLAELSVALGTFAQQADLVAASSGAQSASAQQSVLSTILQSRPDLSALILTDPRGRVAALAPARDSSLNTDISDRDYYLGALTTDGVYISAAQQSTITGQGRVVVLATRVRVARVDGTTETTGVLAAIYNLDTLQKISDGMHEQQSLDLYILDNAGIVITGPGQSRDELNAAPPEFGPLVRSQTDSPSLDLQTTTGAMLAGSAKVANAGWTVIATVNREHALAGLQRLRALVITVAAVLASAMALALWIMLVGQQRGIRTAERARAQAQDLAASERMFRVAFEQAPVGIARIGLDDMFIDANRAYHAMHGYDVNELDGLHISVVAESVDLQVLARMNRQFSDTGSVEQVEVRHMRKDGKIIWVLTSATSLADAAGDDYILCQTSDITERKLIELELNREATHDSLTGLANRALLDKAISRAIDAGQAGLGLSVALIFLDLDGFKEINDRLGHAAGDQVLVEIAARLLNATRPGDTVARIGGDEFVILCEDLANQGPEVVEHLADRILAAVSVGGEFHGAPWQVSASIGVSTPRGAEHSASSLMADADAAMYRAKQQGKCRIELFEPALHAPLADPVTSTGSLDSAVAENRLVVHYQPVIDLASGAIVGAESLIRLIGEDGALVPPDHFLPAAQAHGQIIGFGEWMLRQACRQAVIWRSGLGQRDFGVAVNASVKEVEDSGFLARIDAALADSGLPADALVIELTESAFLRDLPASRMALSGLRERGVRLALDDFGTGFSSLSYLRRFPVDIIKIDKSFVADLLGDDHAALVTRGLLALAQTLEVVLVAEGVEQPAQQEELRRLGCQQAQGYLLGRPMPAEAFTDRLAADVPALRRTHATDTSRAPDTSGAPDMSGAAQTSGALDTSGTPDTAGQHLVTFRPRVRVPAADQGEPALG